MNVKMNNRTGLAGEMRVMSELFLRGHNPAKSYLEEGADVVLENRLRIEVKSAHKCHINRKRGNRTIYLFTLRGGHSNLQECDFVICWCIDEDYFLIIPIADIPSTQQVIGIDKLTSVSKYAKYKNNWDLLRGE